MMYTPAQCAPCFSVTALFSSCCTSLLSTFAAFRSLARADIPEVVLVWSTCGGSGGHVGIRTTSSRSVRPGPGWSSRCRSGTATPPSVRRGVRALRTPRCRGSRAPLSLCSSGLPWGQVPDVPFFFPSLGGSCTSARSRAGAERFGASWLPVHSSRLWGRRRAPGRVRPARLVGWQRDGRGQFGTSPSLLHLLFLSSCSFLLVGSDARFSTAGVAVSLTVFGLALGAVLLHLGLAQWPGVVFNMLGFGKTYDRSALLPLWRPKR